MTSRLPLVSPEVCFPSCPNLILLGKSKIFSLPPLPIVILHCACGIGHGVYSIHEIRMIIILLISSFFSWHRGYGLETNQASLFPLPVLPNTEFHTIGILSGFSKHSHCYNNSRPKH